MKVRAVSSSGRFVCCTRPYNLKKTVIYTVLDLDEGVRGPDNYGGLGYDTDEEIREALARFDSGNAEVSQRNWVFIELPDDQPDPESAALVPILRALVEAKRWSCTRLNR